MIQFKRLKLRPYLIGLILVMSLAGCGAKAPSSPNAPAPAQPATPSAATSESSSAPSPATSTQENTAAGPSDSAAGTLPAESMISAGQLDAGIKAKKDWQIVDVREPNEYATGHVPKAVNIPLGSLSQRINEISKDKDVILVDLNGTRAFTAWQTLTQKGYDSHRVKVLVGGMEQWKSLGSGEITDSIGGC